MNPHATHSTSPVKLLWSAYKNRGLMYSLTKREIVGRYRGSVLGLGWSFFSPILMLAVYTFIFSVVFKARWAGGSDSKTEFALVLFSGLMMFNLFAECISKAPTLIIGNVNFVKKVIFPLEILPIVMLSAAAFHTLVSLTVWLIFYMCFFGIPDPKMFQLIFIMLPFVLLILGSSWFLSSLGVYLQDISQVINIITTALMFLSPIFYPISSLPEEYRILVQISPLTFVVEQARNVMIWGIGLNWWSWFIHMSISSAIAWLGFAWFQRTRKGFPDVL